MSPALSTVTQSASRPLSGGRCATGSRLLPGLSSYQSGGSRTEPSLTSVTKMPLLPGAQGLLHCHGQPALREGTVLSRAHPLKCVTLVKHTKDGFIISEQQQLALLCRALTRFTSIL